MKRTHTSTPLPQDTLHAWVDGRLPPDQAAEQLASADDATRATLRQWQQQRQALQALHREVLDEPVPASMRDVATRAASHSKQAANQMRWSGMVAAVVMAFGLGWMTRAQVPGADTTAVAKASVQSQFVRAAGFAHAVYLPEKRHPVEVGAGEQEHLVQWLSKRLGRSLKVPDLSAQGFTLVGGRLLPGDTGARAQFMFQDAQGMRVTLYLGGLPSASEHPELRETRFQYEMQGTTASFYWFDQDFGYALCGELPRAQLLQLATQVYHQTNG